jgi:hypothetical protein
MATSSTLEVLHVGESNVQIVKICSESVAIWGPSGDVLNLCSELLGDNFRLPSALNFGDHRSESNTHMPHFETSTF